VALVPGSAALADSFGAAWPVAAGFLTRLGVPNLVTSTPADAGAVTIRTADRADLLSVFRIEKVCFPQPWPYAAFERFLGERGFLVACRDDEVLGYVVADVTPNYGRDIGHVKDLAVRPEARGEGLGRRLLDEALTAVTLEGAAVVKLEVRAGNDTALSLYRDVGFETLRRVPGYYEDGEAALVLVLDAEEWRRG
jgi:ribosomal-protein-alanine N-acetyltransferase